MLNLMYVLIHFERHSGLNKKKWFIAYQDECVFSVAYFAPEQVCTSDQPPIHLIEPYQSVFYKNVTQLTVNVSFISVH